MTPPRFEPGQLRRAALRVAEAAIAGAGLDAGPGDARFLMLHALDLDAAGLALRGGEPLGAAGAAALSAALARRLSGEPVARILGAWEFWSLPFHLSPETLVPRPDTETLVEAALRFVPDRSSPLRILDLGTGSGCILVALLSELPNAFGIGLDRAPPALATARENARANGVGARAAFVAGDWHAALCGPFDLVVSNPPYIVRGEIASLSAEVRLHDPAAALDGGADGLDAYRAIVRAGALLAPGAPLLLEVGAGQASQVVELGLGAGLAKPSIVRDLAGHERVVSFRGRG